MAEQQKKDECICNLNQTRMIVFKWETVDFLIGPKIHSKLNPGCKIPFKIRMNLPRENYICVFGVELKKQYNSMEEISSVLSRWTVKRKMHIYLMITPPLKVEFIEDTRKLILDFNYSVFNRSHVVLEGIPPNEEFLQKYRASVTF